MEIGGSILTGRTSLNGILFYRLYRKISQSSLCRSVRSQVSSTVFQSIALPAHFINLLAYSDLLYLRVLYADVGIANWPKPCLHTWRPNVFLCPSSFIFIMYLLCGRVCLASSVVGTYFFKQSWFKSGISWIQVERHWFKSNMSL